ncbi:MAG: coproporphyrinogen III oxidase [Bacteroidetes bacterium]|nr:coproporphyrinogen III oxidase [Bacteroidota bacterium]
MSGQPTKESIADWFRGLQDRICSALEDLDGHGKFQEDAWQREAGGGGRSRVIEGQVIEKGGVNFSAVHGPLPVKIAQTLGLPASDFFATGVSIVLHPVSPMVPIIHMNVRYFSISDHSISDFGFRISEEPAAVENFATSDDFNASQPPQFEIRNPQSEIESWFGGGIDLTPHYVVPEDARFFHQKMQEVCDRHHPDFYPEFKRWADDYFYLKHRHETRGIGGIFFDHLNEKRGLTKEQLFAFVQDVGEAFAPTYAAIALKNKDLAYGERELEWQAVRRGRYVEFNLLWDKGTRFGLDTDGRTESILMSMPPLAKWFYNQKPAPGSREAETLDWLRKNVEWKMENGK